MAFSPISGPRCRVAVCSSVHHQSTNDGHILDYEYARGHVELHVVICDHSHAIHEFSLEISLLKWLWVWTFSRLDLTFFFSSSLCGFPQITLILSLIVSSLSTRQSVEFASVSVDVRSSVLVWSDNSCPLSEITLRCRRSRHSTVLVSIFVSSFRFFLIGFHSPSCIRHHDVDVT